MKFMKEISDIYIGAIKMTKQNKKSWSKKISLIFIMLALLILPAPSFAQQLISQSGLLSDPMNIGVGARPLGMGKAYVGVAENAEAIFTNPAGIARITNPKLSSMYTSLLNEVNYFVIGGAYPLGQRSAIGAGIISSSISDITLTTTTGATIASTGNWSNSTMFLSYATYLNDIGLFSRINRDILLGGSFKYTSVGGSGTTGISNASGTGYSGDLGLLVPVNDGIMVGATYQNLLGGTISKSSGATDELNKSIKLGTKIALIGRDGKALNLHTNRRLYANIDYDMSQSGLPNTSHLGIEFWPSNNLALRAGSDNSELTAGLGLRFSGIEFNYAYHPYHGISENTSHFFSLSYLGEAQQRQLKVHITSPEDKTIVHADHVELAGYVEIIEGDEGEAPAGIITLKVNGTNIPVNADRTFAADIPVEKLGKNFLAIEATDTAGDYVAEDFRIIRLIQFADVPESFWAVRPIEDTGTVGLVEGYPDGNFKPAQNLTRAELTTMMVRAKGLKLPDRPAKQVYKDIPANYWGAKYIEVATMAGLVEGYPDGTFRPNNKITRAEGSAVLVRFDNKQLAQVLEKPYWDVKASYWAAPYIQAAKEAGMLTFVDRNNMKPKDFLKRSESVEMFSKTNLADTEIKDLYSWEKGFKKEFTPVRPKKQASIYQY